MKIGFVGDICLGEHYFSFGHGVKTHYKDNDLLNKIKTSLNDSDLNVANLEGPVSDLDLDAEDPESVVFRGNEKDLAKLVSSNIEIFSIANNHILQHGENCYFDTIDNITKNNAQHIGSSANATLILTPENYENLNATVAISAASDVPDNTYPNQNAYQVINDEYINHVRTLVDKYDHVILFLHWGREDTHLPTPRQQELSKTFENLGVRGIIGHHPHIVYPIEIKEGFFCAYSLGDFLFDLYWDKKLLKSIIFQVQITGKLKSDFLIRTQKVFLRKSGKIPEEESNWSTLQKGSYNPYEFTSAVQNLEIKKYYAFLINLLAGNTKLKSRFFLNKLKFSKNNG